MAAHHDTMNMMATCSHTTRSRNDANRHPVAPRQTSSAMPRKAVVQWKNRKRGRKLGAFDHAKIRHAMFVKAYLGAGVQRCQRRGRVRTRRRHQEARGDDGRHDVDRAGHDAGRRNDNEHHHRPGRKRPPVRSQAGAIHTGEVRHPEPEDAGRESYHRRRVPGEPAAP